MADYLARKAVIRERLLDELVRHVPAAAQHLDHEEVFTPLTSKYLPSASGVASWTWPPLV